MWFDILKVKATATHNSKGEKKDRCAKLADDKYGMKSSAYKSGYMVQCRNGKVSKAKYNLHQWFEEEAEGEKGQPKVQGWVSCQSCEDDTKGAKPCGRKDDTKGTKQRCRKNCDACKTYKRRRG
tara:strand:- start:579 stop:950 length:372 start_codon:yes stop_codon:yes gene_type:complete